jgi:methionyl aminopeptidase
LNHIEAYVEPGITTRVLDNECMRYICDDLQAHPACLDVRFPGATCISVNHVVCHGIPGDKRLKNGDLVNIDVVVRKDDHHGDHSRMFHVGRPTRLGERLAAVTHDAMMRAIDQIRPGVPLDMIGDVVEMHARSAGFSVVRDMCGHGIGRRMHESPQVVHFAAAGSDCVLEPGMTFTVEPIINAGTRHVRTLPDGWTVVTKDHSLSAQWEHTVLVTEGGVEILTAA